MAIDGATEISIWNRIARLEDRVVVLEKMSHSPRPLDEALTKLIDENLRRCAHGYIHISCGDCNGVGAR